MSLSMPNISNISAKGVWNAVKTGANEYGHFVFGEHANNMGTALRTSIKKDGYKDLFEQTKKAYMDTRAKRPDNLAQSIKQSATGLWDDLGNALGKSTPKIWDKVKKAGSSLGKRMPLIGTAMLLGFETPNLYRAYKDGGIAEGAKETGKVGVKLAGWAAGAIAGQALIPIPFVGAIVGTIASDLLMSKLMGRSFTEKQEEAKEKAAAKTNGAQAVSGADAQVSNPFDNKNIKYNRYGIPYAPGYDENGFTNKPTQNTQQSSFDRITS